MQEFDLRKLQLVEFEMLKDIAAYCDKHEIVYFLYAGTLLGAARHKGFIPWDDDIDICMDTENYQKFLKSVNDDKLPDKYVVQNVYTEPHFPEAYTKIRLKGTTSMYKFLKNYDIQQGICIDVFQMSGCAEGKYNVTVQFIKNKVFFFLINKYRFLELYNQKAISRRKFLIHKLIYTVLPEASRRKLIKSLDTSRTIDTHATHDCFSNLWADPTKLRFPSSMFTKENRIMMMFESVPFYCPKDYDSLLTETYGDWRSPPPVVERQGHGDIIVDFDHDSSYYRNSSSI